MESSTVFLLGVVIAALVVIAAIVGIKASTRKREAQRIASLIEALAASGFSVTEGAEIPSEVPDWEIAPRRTRTDQAIRFERGESTGFVFDHVQFDEGYTGWNMESSSGGDSGTTRTYRHTLVCLHAPSLATPSFAVIPNVRAEMNGVIDGNARDLAAAGHTKSAGALEMLMGVVGSLVATQERPGAMTLEGDPELTAQQHLRRGRIGRYRARRRRFPRMPDVPTRYHPRGTWPLVDRHLPRRPRLRIRPRPQRPTPAGPAFARADGPPRRSGFRAAR